MNPHFIFNTLNSIQLYILEKDPISSHKYLTMFARLMRMTLDNAQQTTITLREEIDALKLYLALEALRLENKFSYTIDIEDEGLLKHRVPTLLIQPFVENSIWHGIMLKPNQSGKISIKLSSRGHAILCSIIDDGVGRDLARKLQQEARGGRQSHGFKITSQRIELLSTLYRDKFSIRYIDLFTPQGDPKGTQVDLIIPVNINEQNLLSSEV